MDAPVPADASWLTTLQALLHYYLPPVQQSPTSVTACTVAAMVGIIIAFRSARLAASLVCLAGVGLGALGGFRLAEWIQTPGPISAAAVGAVGGIFAYRTHRIWLGAGSIIVLVTAALIYQLGQNGDWAALLPESAGAIRANGGGVTLVEPAEQMKNLYPKTSEQVRRLVDTVAAELRGWGVRGWLVPAVGLLFGVVLAIWALQLVAVAWLALLGSILAVVGIAGLLAMASPTMQPELIKRPELLVAAVGGLWVFGLVWQAKLARFGDAAAEDSPSARS
ncbi:MAG: hypothetical protein L6Q92_01270 [Phycisphaerae bacterium]|nr:hypothetical protein [Phycisphaerae bacterium]